MAKRLSELDYYSLLGVARDANVDDIKAAFHVFARKYHPDRFATEPDKLRRNSAIYRRGTEAYRVLNDPESRSNYDRTLSEGGLRYDPSKVRSSMRPSVAPSGQGQLRTGKARPFVVRAEQAMRQKNYAQAKLNYQIALGHEPQSDELKQKLQEAARLARG